MSTKQAACLNCRRSKIKCRRDEGASNCARCLNVGIECVIPEFHIGRQKGVKNKRSGLDKAIHQVESALKKRKTDTPANRNTLEHLKELLNISQSNDDISKPTEPNSTSGDVHSSVERDMEATSDDHLALEGVENPLQLLARASDLRMASPQSFDDSTSPPSTRVNGIAPATLMDVHRFFLPMRANLDQGPGLDPVDVGLVTLQEAEMLLKYFHSNLAHTRWGLDPRVHTTPFVRSRSAFLFTTLLAMTAIFLPETASLAKRLLLHRKFLAEQVITRKFRSVEIILGFMVSIPWMPPGMHASDDDTSFYLATSLSIALDLCLDKIIVPSTFLTLDRTRQIPRADCLDARKALAMDGFEDVETESEWGQRLLRRRERVWIALFVLERGVCLARGRSYCVPKTSLIQCCDQWHSHARSHTQDGALTSMAVLRRDLDDLFANVKSRCDNYRATDGGSRTAQEIDWAIESFFDNWKHVWTSVIGDTENKTLPPYVEILVTHLRLSTYGMLLNHASAPAEVKRSFRASALSSALNVMRAAIQGESRLKSVPNNTVTMICFAASIALALSTPVASKSGNKNLAPSVRHLIEDTATVLERIGSTPAHRNGSSVVYGRFLRVLVNQVPVGMPPPGSIPSNADDLRQGSSNPFTGVYTSTPTELVQDPAASFWPELDFSAMSYNEVNETVTNSQFFSVDLLDMPWDQSNSLMLSDWMNLPNFNFSS